MNMFKPTSAQTPTEYLAMIDEPRRSEVQKLHNFIQEVVPDLKPYIMSGMIGYGKYHYKYASGREGDWMVIGLASQKNYISVYVCATEDGTYIAENYSTKLPKASIGKSCIRFKQVKDIDLAVLKEVILKGAQVLRGETVISQ